MKKLNFFLGVPATRGMGKKLTKAELEIFSNLTGEELKVSNWYVTGLYSTLSAWELTRLSKALEEYTNVLHQDPLQLGKEILDRANINNKETALECGVFKLKSKNQQGK